MNERREFIVKHRPLRASPGPERAAYRLLTGRGQILDVAVEAGYGSHEVEVYTAGAMIAHVLTFASYRRTLVAGALHDAGCEDLDSGDPIRWITQAI
jgi:hypothetical protein